MFWVKKRFNSVVLAFDLKTEMTSSPRAKLQPKIQADGRVITFGGVLLHASMINKNKILGKCIFAAFSIISLTPFFVPILFPLRLTMWLFIFQSLFLRSQSKVTWRVSLNRWSQKDLGGWSLPNVIFSSGSIRNNWKNDTPNLHWQETRWQRHCASSLDIRRNLNTFSMVNAEWGRRGGGRGRERGPFLHQKMAPIDRLTDGPTDGLTDVPDYSY